MAEFNIMYARLLAEMMAEATKNGKKWEYHYTTTLSQKIFQDE